MEEENHNDDIPSRISDSNRYRSNPVSEFQKTILDVVEEPENFDFSTVFDKALNFVNNANEPRRPDETPDQYKTRVFAELMTSCELHDDPTARGKITARDHRRLHDLVLSAREAAESGRAEKARRSYLRLIAITDGADPAYWLLYGAFCARDGDLDAASVCGRRAVALDGRDRMALFALTAVLMTTDHEDRRDEVETLLDALASEHPRFGEGHVLAAVHYRRMDMVDRADRSWSLARRFADSGPADDDAYRVLLIGLATVWDAPATDGGEVDPAMKCAVLLCRLELVDLAATCLRCFAATHDDPYQYMMAVTHYRRAEYVASADHLNSMFCRRSAFGGGGWTLLAAHVDYGAGRIREAVVRYIGLSLVPHQSRYGLAYSRVAGHFAAAGRYAEAADAYHRACDALPVPALMTRLATCLAAIERYAEAERLLVGAVAEDGAYDGDAWHKLATLYGTTGRVEMADVCRQRAAELGYESELFTRRLH